MTKQKYEGNIEGYSFVMNDGGDAIEVYKNPNVDYPDHFIYINEGSIQNEKDFHYEIADWFIQNS